MASAQPGAKECERTTGIRNEKSLNKEQCLDKKEEARMRIVLDNQYQRWIQRASEDEVDGSLLLVSWQT